MKKLKKILIGTLILLAILILLLFIIYKIKSKVPNNNNVKQIIEDYDCELLDMGASSEKGYKYDLYVKFSSKTVEDGESYKSFYEAILQKLTYQIKKNYRVIDESQNIIIRVIYNNDTEKMNYTINGDVNFFEDNDTIASIQERTKENEIDIGVQSEELVTIVNNGFSRKKSEYILGNKENTDDNGYTEYSKGIKIKVVNSKIYNFIFETSYNGYVFDGIRTGMDNSEIENILGDKIEYEDNQGIVIGFKTKYFYAFFDNGEISVYMPDQYNEEENNTFISLVSELNKDNSEYKTFLSGVTDLYKDYYEYKQETSKIELIYPTRGFRIVMGSENENSGIYYYSNYQGYIEEGKTLDDIKTIEDLPKNTYFINNNLVFSTEYDRCQKN